MCNWEVRFWRHQLLLVTSVKKDCVLDQLQRRRNHQNRIPCTASQIAGLQPGFFVSPDQPHNHAGGHQHPRVKRQLPDGFSSGMTCCETAHQQCCHQHCHWQATPVVLLGIVILVLQAQKQCWCTPKRCTVMSHNCSWHKG